MKPQTQLQELESAILQRRTYLQQQDQQLQANQQTIVSQQQQIKANKAQLAKQGSRLNSLQKDADVVLELLKEKAEQEASQKLTELTRQGDELQRKIAKQKRHKAQLQQAIDNSDEHLAKLDHDIIEADAIHNELLDLIHKARKLLKDIEHRTEFQVSVVTKLESERDDLILRLERDKKARQQLSKESDQLNLNITTQQQTLKSLSDQILERTDTLNKLNQQMADTQKSLNKLLKQDKDFRRNLAAEKQKLERDQENMKATKQALNTELQVRQQIDPKFKLKVIEEPSHFKL